MFKKHYKIIKINPELLIDICLETSGYGNCNYATELPLFYKEYFSYLDYEDIPQYGYDCGYKYFHYYI